MTLLGSWPFVVGFWYSLTGLTSAPAKVSENG